MAKLKVAPVCEVNLVDEKKVLIAKKKLENIDRILEMSHIFKLLGEPTRFKIVLALMDTELCVCDLASSLEYNVSTVSHQLRLLRNARIVNYRKNGKMVYYSLDGGRISKIVNEAINHYSESR